MLQRVVLCLAVCGLGSASSLPLASATSSQTTTTKGAKLGGRLFRKSVENTAAVAAAVATPVSGERKPKAPHCRDTKAGCTHAAKMKVVKRTSKPPAAEQAEAKHMKAAEHKVATATPSTSAVHRLPRPKHAKVAAARASSAAEATWSRFDQKQGHGHEDLSGQEDRSGHASATVRTMPAGGATQAFSLFKPGAFYPS